MNPTRCILKIRASLVIIKNRIFLLEKKTFAFFVFYKYHDGTFCRGKTSIILFSFGENKPQVDNDLRQKQSYRLVVNNPGHIWRNDLTEQVLQDTGIFFSSHKFVDYSVTYSVVYGFRNHSDQGTKTPFVYFSICEPSLSCKKLENKPKQL